MNAAQRECMNLLASHEKPDVDRALHLNALAKELDIPFRVTGAIDSFVEAARIAAQKAQEAKSAAEHASSEWRTVRGQAEKHDDLVDRATAAVIEFSPFDPDSVSVNSETGDILSRERVWKSPDFDRKHHCEIIVTRGKDGFWRNGYVLSCGTYQREQIPNDGDADGTEQPVDALAICTAGLRTLIDECAGGDASGRALELRQWVQSIRNLHCIEDPADESTGEPAEA